jgi:methionyl-tRNA formyltransferase
MMRNLIYCGVVTNPDKQKNRGMKVAESDVKIFAKEKNIAIYQPEKVKGNNVFIEKIKELNPDVICVVAYRKNSTKRNLRNTKISGV